MIGDGEPDRNRSRVRLEREALRMGATVRYGSKTHKFEKLLADISDPTAPRACSPSTETRIEASTSCSTETTDRNCKHHRGLSRRRNHGRLTTIEKADRYSEWFEAAEGLDFLGPRPDDGENSKSSLPVISIGPTSASSTCVSTTRRGRSARAERSERPQTSGSDESSDCPSTGESDRLAKLAAENIEQHLNLSADLFDEMLAGITLRQGAVVPRLRQDGAVVAADAQFWSDIPERRIGGRSIQQFLRHVAKLCRAETYRPKASYAPGVTGTALSMRDRIRLLDPDLRAKTPGAQRLFEALHGAIGHNLLHVAHRPPRQERHLDGPVSEPTHLRALRPAARLRRVPRADTGGHVRVDARRHLR